MRKQIDRKDAIGMTAVASLFFASLCLGHVVLLQEPLTPIIAVSYLVVSALTVNIGLLSRLIRERKRGVHNEV